jgi:hypothetical protein
MVLYLCMCLCLAVPIFRSPRSQEAEVSYDDELVEAARREFLRIDARLFRQQFLAENGFNRGAWIARVKVAATAADFACVALRECGE